MVSDSNQDDAELGNVGFAKQVATNETKYYNNKDKVVLADKRLQPQDMQNMYKPVLQIMDTSSGVFHVLYRNQP
ncbi:hypothetical protein INT48_002905 [Thamnidium elegans]|uniref:Uncharacterized protein n=1 Tax=Thamnidium elegans TaxID=101142 RepID=A0A8H7SNI3_9FUNG|nr:hypothetical protein INT48_002905 [Thamnidium elegans]